MDPYQKLLAKIREIMLIDSISGILYWDLKTYIPPRGVQQRSEQLALLSQLRHRNITNHELKELLEQTEKSFKASSPNLTQKRNLYLIHKEVEEETKLPEELVAKIAKQRAITLNIWKKAKAARDWKMFQPEFEKMLDLTKQKAELLMEVKELTNPYDALLDNFEPGITSNQITQEFTQVRRSLVPLIDKYIETSESIKTDFLYQTIPITVQRKIATDLVTLIEYDVTSDDAGGRIDETEHPFSSGLYDDVRITVHYYEDNIASAIFAVLHESGHALYDQNLNPDWRYQPIGESASSGIHESQSRFIENIIGRSRSFWEFYLPRLNELTNGAFATARLDDFVRAVNCVKRSKIRIAADEVTYSLHIIIRFEIEQALYADKIEISELPNIWNDKYAEYLGVKVEHDSEGVMQDIHWAAGAYGYFPSYALGNIYGSQLLEAMENEVPDWQIQIAAGKVRPVKQWLVENVHRNSRLYDPADLIHHITGKPPSARPFLQYIERKYSQLLDV